MRNQERGEILKVNALLQVWNRVKAGEPELPAGLTFLQFSKALRLVAFAQINPDMNPKVMDERFRLPMNAALWEAAGNGPLPPPRIKNIVRSALSLSQT